jgi:hypothetical protein
VYKEEVRSIWNASLRVERLARESDMPHYRGHSCFAVLLVLLAICRDGHCNPAEPQATFLLKDGWVEFALRKDGRPVGSATILIMDEKGVKFAEGETGKEGQTAKRLFRFHAAPRLSWKSRPGTEPLIRSASSKAMLALSLHAFCSVTVCVRVADPSSHEAT